MEEKEAKKISLLNIMDGAAVEMFDIAMGKVLDNIRDINTSIAGREILLKVQLIPSKDRSIIEIKVGVNKKLAGQDVLVCTADLKLDKHGRSFAVERRNQMGLPFPNNVTVLETKEEQND